MFELLVLIGIGFCSTSCDKFHLFCQPKLNEINADAQAIQSILVHLKSIYSRGGTVTLFQKNAIIFASRGHKTIFYHSSNVILLKDIKEFVKCKFPFVLIKYLNLRQTT